MAASSNGENLSLPKTMRERIRKAVYEKAGQGALYEVGSDPQDWIARHLSIVSGLIVNSPRSPK